MTNSREGKLHLSVSRWVMESTILLFTLVFLIPCFAEENFKKCPDDVFYFHSIDGCRLEQKVGTLGVSYSPERKYIIVMSPAIKENGKMLIPSDLGEAVDELIHAIPESYKNKLTKMTYCAKSRNGWIQNSCHTTCGAAHFPHKTNEDIFSHEDTLIHDWMKYYWNLGNRNNPLSKNYKDQGHLMSQAVASSIFEEVCKKLNVPMEPIIIELKRYRYMGLLITMKKFDAPLISFDLVAPTVKIKNDPSERLISPSFMDPEKPGIEILIPSNIDEAVNELIKIMPESYKKNLTRAKYCDIKNENSCFIDCKEDHSEYTEDEEIDSRPEDLLSLWMESTWKMKLPNSALMKDLEKYNQKESASVFIRNKVCEKLNSPFERNTIRTNF